MFWLIIISVILIIIAAAMLIQFFNVIFRGFAPFISTKPKVIGKIIENMDFFGQGKVYELGCGKAGFLRAVELEYPRAELAGVEYSFWPWLIAKIQISLNKSKIKIKRKNLLKVNLADADLIYCYLSPRLMKDLKEKFGRECKQGTKIISHAFILPDSEPDKIVELESGENIYFYTI
ncbi:hypothetical protein KKC83_01940 [Patescibacteria group bacterium]|nr:hypothetical protein [Candidatus Falkowbacteria bacterium]MBU3905601.1 hypothetical protein [Patescibacteria group bacterium]MCG2698379.1 hypothetical protein [Candidatus Parcubacteria bacterium]MBU4015794.1 hypothetical protein [Patescibacteria group bacterium]MBU4026286.1 hypothetical protein [Patescibacteria group bacterium]